MELNEEIEILKRVRHPNIINFHVSISLIINL